MDQTPGDLVDDTAILFREVPDGARDALAEKIRQFLGTLTRDEHELFGSIVDRS